MNCYVEVIFFCRNPEANLNLSIPILFFLKVSDPKQTDFPQKKIFYGKEVTIKYAQCLKLAAKLRWFTQAGHLSVFYGDRQSY